MTFQDAKINTGITPHPNGLKHGVQIDVFYEKKQSEKLITASFRV